MIKNYIKVALRNIYKNKLYSFINIIGLGVAIAVCVVAYLNFEFSNSFDSFHEKGDRIYSINHFKVIGERRQDWGYTPTPMAKLLKMEMPAVKRASRIVRNSGTLKYGDKIFNEGIQYVDPDYFNMFTYPVVTGNANALEDNRNIIIDENTALKYFGDENPLGKQITIILDGQQSFEFLVGAVIENSPKNSTLPLNIVLAYDSRKFLHEENSDDWAEWCRGIFVELYDNSSVNDVQNHLQTYLEPVNQANPDWLTDGFYMIPLLEVSKRSIDLNLMNSSFRNIMHPAAILAPSIIAVLILLLASFNFVNTAIAFAAKRLKEIGVRKVIGGVRKQIIRQFLGENLILCFFALMLGLVLAEIFVPAYQSLWPDLDLRIDYSDNLNLFGFLAGLLFFTAIAAGSYPAFYVSSFKPAGILKGDLKLGGTNPLIRILLTFQFVLAITTIVGGLVMTNNADYIASFDIGVNTENIIHVPLEGDNRYDVFKGVVEKNPNIKSITGGRHIVGWGYSISNVEIKGEETELARIDIGENYLSTMGINLLKGRTLNPDMEEDIQGSILVNKAFVDKFGFEKPIGEIVKFKIDEEKKEFRVVGVIDDLYFNGLWRKVQPMAMKILPRDQYSLLTVRTEAADIKATFEYLEAKWKELFPLQSFQGVYQTQVFEGAANINNSIKMVMIYIALIAIIISCMGLFAIVALNIAKRTKEIGVRKILGASVMNIGKIISREFLIILSVSSILGAASGYYMSKMMLASIWAYYVNIGIDIYILSSLIIFGMAIITVASQVISIASANPVNSLRDE